MYFSSQEKKTESLWQGINTHRVYVARRRVSGRPSPPHFNKLIDFYKTWYETYTLWRPSQCCILVVEKPSGLIAMWDRFLQAVRDQHDSGSFLQSQTLPINSSLNTHANRWLVIVFPRSRQWTFIPSSIHPIHMSINHFCEIRFSSIPIYAHTQQVIPFPTKLCSWPYLWFPLFRATCTSIS